MVLRASRLCGCAAASPFLAKPIQVSFAGLGDTPKSPPARAPHCALVGGYMKEEQARKRCGGRGQCGGKGPRLLREAYCGRCSHRRPLRASRLRGCVAVSPFLAKPIQMGFAGSGNSPKSPPARAPHCALVGGYMKEEQAKSQLLWGGCPGRPGHLSTAAFAGRFSPISSVAALAWCPTVCRGTDDCGEHHPSTVAALAF